MQIVNIAGRSLTYRSDRSVDTEKISTGGGESTRELRSQRMHWVYVHPQGEKKIIGVVVRHTFRKKARK